MSKHCIAEWIYLVVLAAGSFRTTSSIEEAACETLNKKCVLVTECVSAIDLVKTRKYIPLRKMFCGFDGRGPKVCCPIDSEIVFTNDTETATSRIKTTTATTTTTTTVEEDQYGLPSRKVCGLNSDGQNRIVGGDITSIEEFPWATRIKSKSKKNDRDQGSYFSCGGSLISDRYVITAAHCVKDREQLMVRLGEWDEETEIDCVDGVCSDPPVDVNVTKVLIHESFTKETLTSDIALLLLEKPVNFTDFIRPICLPIRKYPMTQDYVNGTLFWTAGWGLTEFGSTSVIKRKVALDTVPMNTCRNKIRQIEIIGEDNVICAGGKIGKDTCRGDSGGPLLKEITEDGAVNWYLYGITSFGTRSCGVTDTPSVYTRVTAYIDWIKSAIAP